MKERRWKIVNRLVEFVAKSKVRNIGRELVNFLCKICPKSEMGKRKRKIIYFSGKSLTKSKKKETFWEIIDPL